MAVCGVKPLSTHSVCLCHNVAMCLSSPMSHIPQLVLSQLCYHDCRMGGGGGGGFLRWRWTGSWTENVEFGEQISCLANAEEVRGQQSVDADSPERHTLPRWDELRKNYYDSQLLKNVSHLNCARTMCLHHLNSQIQTHICCSQYRQWCMNPGIWLLSVFLKKKKRFTIVEWSVRARTSPQGQQKCTCASLTSPYFCIWNPCSVWCCIYLCLARKTAGERS